MIYAPKSGLASLYARDEGKGGVIRKLKAGSVVMVMGESGKYTKVYGEETVGYVITSALAFCDVVEEAQPAAVTRKTNLRLVNRDNGRKILELPAGGAGACSGGKGQVGEGRIPGLCRVCGEEAAGQVSCRARS